MNFPIFNSKELSKGKTYDLNDPSGRWEYFNDKVGKEIEEIKEYLDENTFVAFLLSKKGSGKGTYSKMFQEIIGEDRVATVSVGDVVRETHRAVETDKKELGKLKEYLEANYRGFISVDEAVAALLNRDQSTLIPSELILALVKKEIEKHGRKAIFIDGLPRNLDQISYSLYFRDLINFRDDPDFFVLIDVPETVIDERIKHRRVCPICKTSRNTVLLPTKFVKYNKEKDEFYLLCDNADCSGYEKQELVAKEGDEAGIASIRERLDLDGKLVEMATNLYGVPKVLIRNAIPVDIAYDYAEDYELTPEFSYTLESDGSVRVKTSPWVIKDDDGVDSYSLMAPAPVLSLLIQAHKILIG